jgi:hypothetical protein
MERKLYYAIGPNCWGIGKTQEEAIKNAKANWPAFIKPRRPRPEHFSVYATDAPEITVSDFDGSMSVAAGFSVEKLQTSSLAKKESVA